ncbi:MAG: hypothetical protein WBB91_05280, partial [Nostocoides sp.]|uniref:hypothetical protein n=1 Tax=Nostocoides sp. TaxID=1917966 RepID=UPI003C784DBE
LPIRVVGGPGAGIGKQAGQGGLGRHADSFVGNAPGHMVGNARRAPDLIDSRGSQVERALPQIRATIAASRCPHRCAAA